jgi:hypothetical protein
VHFLNGFTACVGKMEAGTDGITKSILIEAASCRHLDQINLNQSSPRIFSFPASTTTTTSSSTDG